MREREGEGEGKKERWRDRDVWSCHSSFLCLVMRRIVFQGDHGVDVGLPLHLWIPLRSRRGKRRAREESRERGHLKRKAVKWATSSGEEVQVGAKE